LPKRKSFLVATFRFRLPGRFASLVADSLEWPFVYSLLLELPGFPLCFFRLPDLRLSALILRPSKTSLLARLEPPSSTTPVSSAGKPPAPTRQPSGTERNALMAAGFRP